MRTHTSRSALQLVVGVFAIAAPALHLLTDIMEWRQGGFSPAQLWLNYAAFLPMPWLLLGVYAVHEPKPNLSGLLGAVLYGASFTYFAHTTLYALVERIPDYETLWMRLGSVYTIHGAMMVCGGVLFAWSVLRARQLPTLPVLLFLGGLLVNLILGLLPLPDGFQIFGSALRNAGLIALGYGILVNPHAGARDARMRST